ncbi:MAG TPA: hypothetical protein PLY32_05500 [Salinivirgaceae bacterium]|nr:hypothetical protein [Salinivirgaceae bacterium]HQA76556.1 hypothetical protein [Salinivirgaceae bacterium]
MRILALVFTIAFGTVSLFAQDDEAKQEKVYTPESGDFSIGLDGTPVFNYIGNMFNGNMGNAFNPGDNTFYFKYFLTDKSAARIVLGITNKTKFNRFYVGDDAALLIDPNSNAQLEDLEIDKKRDMGIRLGYQQFRGYKRLLGFYGADIGYRYEKTHLSYKYGNEMNELNPAPTTQWGNNAVRRLEVDNGAKNSIFAGVFTGAEYYLLPKICVGMELGLFYGVTLERQSWRKQERMVLTQHVEEEIAVEPSTAERETVTKFPYTYGNFYFAVHF